MSEILAKAKVCFDIIEATMDVDPYEAFEWWLGRNGFQDILDSPPEQVNLERLEEAIEKYGQSDNT